MNQPNRDRENHRRSAQGGARGFARRQGGQAIVWFLATAAACCAVLALVYNVGQVANEKEKTINAADAAALSAGLVEARMLNFMAYTNRAMIANEVFIAQFESFDSWIRYDNQLVQNASLIPIVGDFIQAFGGAELNAFVVGVLPGIEPAVVSATDTYINTGLATVRDVANGAAVLAAQDMARQIAEANQAAVVDDNGLEVAAVALNEQAWNDFTKVYTGDDRGNAAQVVVDSLDEFSTNRGLGHAFDPLNLATVTGVDKTSGSIKLRDFDHWEAEDSADVWVGLSVLGIDVGKAYVLPIGWGRADVNNNGDTGKDWDFGGGPCTQFFVAGCELAYLNDQGISGWSGIPGIRDLVHPGNANNDPSLTYVVAVKKATQPGSGLTTQNIGTGMNNVPVSGPQGSPQMTDNLLGNRNELASISAARVFFARPSDPNDRTARPLLRSDGKQEFASLYNPYWQARLADPASVQIQGVSAKTFLYTALGQGQLCLRIPSPCQ